MKILKILLGVVGFILLAGVIAFFAWFHNPYEHTLQLDADSVYADQGDGFLITNTNIIDVESGNLLENQHLLIRDGIIDRIFTGTIPDSLTEIYQVAEGKLASFLMLNHNPLENFRNSQSIDRMMLEKYWIE